MLYFIFGVFFFRYWIERAWDSIQWQKTKTKNLSLVHQNGGMRKWNYRSSDVNFMISLFQRNSCLKIGPHQTFENHCTEKTNWFRTYFRPIWLPCRRLMLIFVNKHKRYTTFVKALFVCLFDCPNILSLYWHTLHNAQFFVTFKL